MRLRKTQQFTKWEQLKPRQQPTQHQLPIFHALPQQQNVHRHKQPQHQHQQQQQPTTDPSKHKQQYNKKQHETPQQNQPHHEQSSRSRQLKQTQTQLQKQQHQYYFNTLVWQNAKHDDEKNGWRWPNYQLTHCHHNNNMNMSNHDNNNSKISQQYTEGKNCKHKPKQKHQSNQRCINKHNIIQIYNDITN